MIRIDPVGESEAIHTRLQHAPLPRHVLPHAVAEAAGEFQASLLAQHALQLDPDGAQRQAATPEQLAAQLARLLALLQERSDDLKERALLAGGKPAHGLFAELEQVGEVLARLVGLWPQLAQSLPQQQLEAKTRLRPMFGNCHFLLRVLQHSAEHDDWQRLATSLADSERELLA